VQAPNTRLVLAAMVFAVAMTFIDQTIVAATFIVAVRGLPRGRIEPAAISDDSAAEPAPELSR
jgi:hypothetical protein